MVFCLDTIKKCLKEGNKYIWLLKGQWHCKSNVYPTYYKKISIINERLYNFILLFIISDKHYKLWWLRFYLLIKSNHSNKKTIVYKFLEVIIYNFRTNKSKYINKAMSIIIKSNELNTIIYKYLLEAGMQKFNYS